MEMDIERKARLEKMVARLEKMVATTQLRLALETEEERRAKKRNEFNWASEASPTLGCSIDISRDIYIYMYVCMSSIVYGKTIQKKSYAKMRGRNYIVQTRSCSKSSFVILKRRVD